MNQKCQNKTRENENDTKTNRKQEVREKSKIAKRYYIKWRNF